MSGDNSKMKDQIFCILKVNIDDAKWRIGLCQTTVDFWRTEERRVKEEYDNSGSPFDHEHLLRVKEHLDSAEEEMRSWQKELDRLQRGYDALLP